jgi:hypothetical protein
MTVPDAVALRRSWTRRSKDHNKQYSDWHLIDVVAQAQVDYRSGTVTSLCGGTLPPERTENPGQAGAFKRVCPSCIQALMVAQRPKHGW